VLDFRYAPAFKKDYRQLSTIHQDQVDRVLELLSENLWHPSLHVKKVQGRAGVWEARVSQSHRITFHFAGKYQGLDVCVLRRVGTHAVLKNP